MSKTIQYTTSGTCSRQINVDIDDAGRISHVEIVGGCPGNTVGLARMVEGRMASDVIDLLEGIPCGTKTTSCPDQLARALRQALAG